MGVGSCHGFDPHCFRLVRTTPGRFFGPGHKILAMMDKLASPQTMITHADILEVAPAFRRHMTLEKLSRALMCQRMIP